MKALLRSEIIFICFFLAVFFSYVKADEIMNWWEPVKIGEKWGFKDLKTGEVVIKAQFDNAQRFYYGLAAVKIKDKWGFIHEKEKYVIRPQYDNTKGFSSDGFAAVKGAAQPLKPPYASDKWGYIDRAGKYVISPQFDDAKDTSFSRDGLAAVQVGNKWGYIDKKGKFVINPQFHDCSAWFSCGLAAVKVGDKWGFVNKTGDIVINPMFDNYWKSVGGTPHFFEGKAKVEFLGKTVEIDMRGEIISPEWEFWSQMEGVEGTEYAFYNKTKMSYPSKDTVKVWVRGYKQDKEMSMTLIEMDCLNKKFHYMIITEFDRGIIRRCGKSKEGGVSFQ